MQAPRYPLDDSAQTGRGRRRHRCQHEDPMTETGAPRVAAVDSVRWTRMACIAVSVAVSADLAVSFGAAAVIVLEACAVDVCQWSTDQILGRGFGAECRTQTRNDWW